MTSGWSDLKGSVPRQGMVWSTIILGYFWQLEIGPFGHVLQAVDSLTSKKSGNPTIEMSASSRAVVYQTLWSAFNETVLSVCFCLLSARLWWLVMPSMLSTVSEAHYLSHLWRVNCAMRCVCDKLTSDELTEWWDDHVRTWLVVFVSWQLV